MYLKDPTEVALLNIESNIPPNPAVSEIPSSVQEIKNKKQQGTKKAVKEKSRN